MPHEMRDFRSADDEREESKSESPACSAAPDHLQFLQSWFEFKVGDWQTKVWQDADGDFGIEDKHGYSIVIHASSAVRLRDWLNEFIARDSQ